MIRLIPRFGNPVDPATLDSVDAMVQARIDRRITRRQLIERAGQLGIGAAVTAIALRAAGDVSAAPTRTGGVTPLRGQAKETVPVTGPTAPEGTKVEGGTLILGGDSEPDTLHPYLTQLLVGFDMFSAVMEGLLGLDENLALVPTLATEYSISDDGLNYTFTLREGVKFHNGEDFVADDVINTWKVVNDPDFGTYNTYGWDYVTDVTKSADGKQVTITTGAPYAPLLSLTGIAPIVPSSAVKDPQKFATDFGNNLIGTGPFKLEERVPQQQISFVRNDEYWGEKAILDKLIYKISPDDNTLLVQLRTGEIQATGSDSSLQALRVKEALDIEGITILENPSAAWNHLDLKIIDHLRDPRVRQALDFATPKQQIIEQLLENRVLPSAADITPDIWAWDPDLQPTGYDPDKAKSLLEEAGLTFADGGWSGPTPAPEKDVDVLTDKNGPVKPLEIELWAIAGSKQTELIAQVIVQAWQQIGVKAEQKFEDISTIFGPEGYQFTEKMTAGLYSWTNSADPDNTWYWSSQYIPETPTGAGGNVQCYFFPFNFQDEIDAIIDPAVEELDQDKRKEAYFASQKLINEQAPVVFLYWEKLFSPVANNIGGFLPTTFNSLFWNAGTWYLTE
ncbi:MAG TPA: peptide ABC transporter substrate-binding protein [Thermomicrobiales bacterium]|nr:peptide ABC transporter substrate-binding protein [Thermomicrobiales bacterium]